LGSCQVKEKRFLSEQQSSIRVVLVELVPTLKEDETFKCFVGKSMDQSLPLFYEHTGRDGPKGFGHVFDEQQ
jgi:hypothetical protein